MSKNSLTVFISGSSGVGKNTIINRLLSDLNNGEFIVSNTTRAQRESDKKVGQYKFISKSEFEEKINNGDILEYDIYNDNYYGVSKKDILDNVNNDKILLKDLTVKGVINCKELLKDVMPLCCVFVTEKKKVLKQRLINRGESRKNIKKRLAFYKSEHEMIPFYDFVVVNNDFEKTIKEFKAVINTKKNNLPILTNITCQDINIKKIDKYVNQLEKGKKLKPIIAGAFNDRVYILDGINRYLAYLKCGLSCCIHMSNKNYKINYKDENINEWLKVIENYTKK